MEPADFENKIAELGNLIQQSTSATEKARMIAAVYKMLKNTNAQVTVSEYYRYLYTGYFHQDRLSWSRAQIVLGIELAALAGAFAGDHSHRAIFILLSANIFIGLSWVLIWRDWQQRDAFRDDYKTLHQVFNPSSERAFAKKIDRNQYRWGIGKLVLYGIMGSILLANIGLSFVAYYCASGWATLCK